MWQTTTVTGMHSGALISSDCIGYASNNFTLRRTDHESGSALASLAVHRGQMVLALAQPLLHVLTTSLNLLRQRKQTKRLLKTRKCATRRPKQKSKNASAAQDKYGCSRASKNYGMQNTIPPCKP